MIMWDPTSVFTRTVGWEVMWSSETWEATKDKGLHPCDLLQQQ